MEKKLTYKEAGVDIDKGEELSQWIKKKILPLTPPEVLSKIGLFSGLYSLNKDAYKQPVLVATTDSVGTKLKIAQTAHRHDTVGIDLVAMCINDLLAQGAKPLFFLDCLSMGKLSLDTGKKIISGVIEGCRRAGCALLGGETAEVPSFYKQGEYDLVGFAVGIVEKDEAISGSKIKPGDKILGLSSSGLHSNGFSLVRKILFTKGKSLSPSLLSELLKPTRIYTSQIMALLSHFKIKGIAHITGGGMLRNIPRILPFNCKAHIYRGSWEVPSIFSLLQEKGKVSNGEMFKVFNMGIGMVLIVSPEDAQLIVNFLDNQGEKIKTIGEITRGEKEVEIV